MATMALPDCPTCIENETRLRLFPYRRYFQEASREVVNSLYLPVDDEQGWFAAIVISFDQISVNDVDKTYNAIDRFYRDLSRNWEINAEQRRIMETVVGAVKDLLWEYIFFIFGRVLFGRDLQKNDALREYRQAFIHRYRNSGRPVNSPVEKELTQQLIDYYGVAHEHPAYWVLKGIPLVIDRLHGETIYYFDDRMPGRMELRRWGFDPLSVNHLRPSATSYDIPPLEQWWEGHPAYNPGKTKPLMRHNWAGEPLFFHSHYYETFKISVAGVILVLEVTRDEIIQMEKDTVGQEKYNPIRNQPYRPLFFDWVPQSTRNQVVDVSVSEGHTFITRRREVYENEDLIGQETDGNFRFMDEPRMELPGVRDLQSVVRHRGQWWVATLDGRLFTWTVEDTEPHDIETPGLIRHLRVKEDTVYAVTEFNHLCRLTEAGECLPTYEQPFTNVHGQVLRL